MKLSECFDLYHWHDSVVKKIEYEPEKKQLLLRVDLCEWVEPDPFSGKSGRFIFEGVEALQFDQGEPIVKSVVWNAEEISASVLDADPVPNQHRNGSEAAKIVMAFHFWEPKHLEEFGIFYFLAKSVEWYEI